jgi:hypothetical protein
MAEFLINCPDEDWALPFAKWDEVFRPNTIPFRRLPGVEYRIEVAGVPIYFSDESPGIQVCVEGELPAEVARRIVDEVLGNLQRLTGQRGQVIDIG